MISVYYNLIILLQLVSELLISEKWKHFCGTLGILKKEGFLNNDEVSLLFERVLYFDKQFFSFF